MLYAVLAFGASVYGSYRSEPSGVQYAFLPMLATPACLVLALCLVGLGRPARAPVLFRALPFLAAGVLALPASDMLLSDRNLEAARWVTIALGLAHAGLLTAHVWATARAGAIRPQLP